MRRTLTVRRILNVMARRKTQFNEGDYYHIYNRGCNKELIFRDKENYLFLLKRLKVLSQKFEVSVIAYCLMPNHYHLLLRQNSSKPVGTLVQHLFNSYSKAFNERYNRTGTLFEGPYKSIHVDKEEYLMHLCRYIHRNPLDAKLIANIDQWPYSNYLECVGKRKGSLTDRAFIEALFKTHERYREFVLDYEPPEKIRIGISKYMFG